MDLMADRDKLLLCLILRRQIKKKNKYKKRFWVHPLNNLRDEMGEHLKVEKMYHFYPDKFFEYTRLLPNQFDIVLSLVKNEIEKANTTYRKAIPTRTRLFLTLRFLASGDSIRSLSTSYSIGVTTTRTIIKETTTAIWNCLAPIYVKPPSKDQWVKIVENFEEQWQFPNCIGAVDGKHVVLEAPPNSGSAYYNYKGTFSIILLASCDADYVFTTVDIGAYGRESDGGVFLRSSLGKSLEKGTLKIPDRMDIKNSDLSQPCTFVGDEAFSLSINMMRPYPGRFLPLKKRIFNYRLSRARRVIENTFGVMTSRFGITRRAITLHPENAIFAVKACIALHNFLRIEELKMSPNNRKYCPIGYTDTDDESNGDWRNTGDARGLERMTRFGSNMSSKIAQKMRDNLADHFLNNGQVAWQYERAGVTNNQEID